MSFKIKNKRNHFIFAIFVLIIGILYTFNKNPPCPLQNIPNTTISINNHTLQAELSATPESRQCGLAFRDKLSPDTGMLFVFEKDKKLEFWMKDTFIPLTVAFISKNRLILEIHEMTPQQTDRTYTSNVKALYALEASPEWFKQNKIRVGDQVIFDLP